MCLVLRREDVGIGHILNVRARGGAKSQGLQTGDFPIKKGKRPVGGIETERRGCRVGRRVRQAHADFGNGALQADAQTPLPSRDGHFGIEGVKFRVIGGWILGERYRTGLGYSVPGIFVLRPECNLVGFVLEKAELKIVGPRGIEACLFADKRGGFTFSKNEIMQAIHSDAASSRLGRKEGLLAAEHKAQFALLLGRLLAAGKHTERNQSQQCETIVFRYNHRHLCFVYWHPSGRSGPGG